jgi:fatty acid desaturase
MINTFRSMNSPTLKNATAIAYVFVAYALGLIALVQQFWWINIVGILLIVHSLAISTYLTHEFIHGNIFKERHLNRLWGKAMTYLNGACYATWDDLVEHHFNHHLHHADFGKFDLIVYLKQDLHPALVRLYTILEWLYFPAVDFELRWRIILAPFWDERKRHLRLNHLALMVLRTSAACLLAWFSWKALLLFFAYISFVNVARFVDAFQHTYDYLVVGEGFPQRDRLYEQKNTFSNLISVKYPWLNLAFLNFSYHNAHHHNMSCPWHELPALHAKLYGDKELDILLPCSQLISNYHRFRIQRMFSAQGEMDEMGKLKLDTFMGGVGLSLLTPP